MRNSPLVVLVLLVLLAVPPFLGAKVQWFLAQSTVAYEVSHPLQDVVGISHAARGKGVCHASKCSFQITLPVKTFKSRSKSRDAEMLKAVRAAQFPAIVVRFRCAESALASAVIRADLEIRFAGHTVRYKHVPFQRANEGKNETEITGTVPVKLSDFRITPPQFLDIPINNKVLIRLDATWRHP